MVPRRGRRIRLTDRDRWLLEAVAKMRFLRTTQLARLGFGGSRWAAAKRLRPLFDAGLIRVWVRDLARENVYSLDRAGARVLGENHPDGTFAVPRGLDGHLEHLLYINEVRVVLALTLPTAGGELVSWRSDWELRAGTRVRVVPDALFAVRWTGNGDQTFALEIEHQSKSPRAFLKKVLRYGSGRSGFGLDRAPVLVVAVEEKWAERYREALGLSRLERRIWFTTLDLLNDKGAGGAIWQVTAGEERHSLRSLTSLPYSKEGGKT
jgi:hypothetical protein